MDQKTFRAARGRVQNPEIVWIQSEKLTRYKQNSFRPEEAAVLQDSSLLDQRKRAMSFIGSFTISLLLFISTPGAETRDVSPVGHHSGELGAGASGGGME